MCASKVWKLVVVERDGRGRGFSIDESQPEQMVRDRHQDAKKFSGEQ
jgi:hypothetical protein